MAEFALTASRPTLWSCLAAHAAADYLDGVPRRRAPAKVTGVFASRSIPNHPLTEGLPGVWASPHSRYNGLDEIALDAAGYEILTRSETAGADAIVRPGAPLFLFWQGHPEYDGDTLAQEFRRDLRAYLRGEKAILPPVPTGLFAAELEERLQALRREALGGGAPDLLSRWRPSETPPAAAAPWRGPAAKVCANWLRANG